MSALPADKNTVSNAVIGLANLTMRAFKGEDLNPLAQQLAARIQACPDDAAAQMDLATIYFLYHESEIAMQWQMQSMNIQARYSLLSAPAEPALSMLVIMGQGGLMDNLPLEFLLEGSAIAMDMHYMQAGDAVPQGLSDYDLVFIAVGESDTNTALLQHLATQLQDCSVPVINRAEHVMQTTREAAAARLQQVKEIDMPMSVRLSRTELQQLGKVNAPDVLAAYLADQDFPIIVRPVESHGGHGLMRLDEPEAIATYLAEQPEELFYISRFVNYASADGQFWKYRIVLVEGRPFVCHLAISSHWMVHYLNADMTGNAGKCAAEAHCMAHFDEDFGRRHKQALAAIYEQMQLEYLILDCAETAEGKLLVFEVDTSAIVHAMDPPSLFPYKRPQMLNIFSAFQQMLMHCAARS